MTSRKPDLTASVNSACCRLANVLLSTTDNAADASLAARRSARCSSCRHSKHMQKKLAVARVTACDTAARRMQSEHCFTARTTAHLLLHHTQANSCSKRQCSTSLLRELLLSTGSHRCHAALLLEFCGRPACIIAWHSTTTAAAVTIATAAFHCQRLVNSCLHTCSLNMSSSATISNGLLAAAPDMEAPSRCLSRQCLQERRQCQHRVIFTLCALQCTLPLAHLLLQGKQHICVAVAVVPATSLTKECLALLLAAQLPAAGACAVCAVMCRAC